MGGVGGGESTRRFSIIFVLGAPGAGKGTLCAHLAHTHNLSHYSVGDGLRAWMQANRSSPLAERIQEKLDRQGFLTSEDLNPFLLEAIKGALAESKKGILFDGFPRCVEQLEAWKTWPFQDGLPLDQPDSRPDLVLNFHVEKERARERYLARGRDRNDSEEKFEKRFAEFEREGAPVEEAYRKKGLVIDVDANGSKEENMTELMERLAKSERWQKIILTAADAGKPTALPFSQL